MAIISKKLLTNRKKHDTILEKTVKRRSNVYTADRKFPVAERGGHGMREYISELHPERAKAPVGGDG